GDVQRLARLRRARHLAPRLTQGRPHHHSAFHVDAALLVRADVGHEEKQRVAEAQDARTVAGALALDDDTVERRAVAAVEVAHRPMAVAQRDLRVPPRHAGIFDGDAADVAAPERDRLLIDGNSGEEWLPSGEDHHQPRLGHRWIAAGGSALGPGLLERFV